MNNMKLRNLFLGVVMLVGLVVSSFGQTALTSTTLSSAVSDSKTQTVVVGSASGVTAGTTFIYVDRELMDVRAASGTTLTVVRGAGGTRSAPHVSGATVYVGPGYYFYAYSRFGACTATNEVVLPAVNTSIVSPDSASIEDCFGGAWYVDINIPFYKLSMSPGAQRSATSPVAGANNDLTAQAGGAQSATTSNGANGGRYQFTAGIGGAGGSSSGTGGTGGLVTMIGGAGGGTVTGGAGGLATFGGGAGGNGTSAGGTGGGLNIFSGAAGTGGTGTVGAVNIRSGGAAGTAAFAVSTAGATTVASTVSGQAISITPAGSGLLNLTNNGAAQTLPLAASTLVGTLGTYQGAVSVGDTDTNFHALIAAASDILIPANTLNVAGRKIRVHGSGVYTNGAASLLNARVDLCTVSGCATGTDFAAAGCSVVTTNQANNDTNGQFSIDCNMTTTSTLGATGTVMAKALVCAQLTAATTGVQSCFQDTATAVSATFDETVNEFVNISFKFSSSNAANTITLHEASVELVK